MITHNETVAGRMDNDLVFAVARALDCLALELAPERRAKILEDALRRRARETHELTKCRPDPTEPLNSRTIWRTGHEPPLVHWVVAGLAAAGDCIAFEDRDFAACGAEVAGCYVGDEETWDRGTMAEHPITCPKCQVLFQAVEQS
jgi:hypothetical protein